MLYTRAPRLLEELRIAHAEGSFARRLAQLAKLDLLLIDDFAISPITAPERNDLLELLDNRVKTRATLVTSQSPVANWHAWLEEPTLADADLGSASIQGPSHRIEGRIAARKLEVFQTIPGRRAIIRSVTWELGVCSGSR